VSTDVTDSGAAPLLELKRATLGYGGRVVFTALDLVVRRGAFVAIVGPNGSGKTTLVRALLGLIAPTRGMLARAGAPRGAVAPLRVGYVPQRARLDPLFPLAVRDVIAMGRYPHVGPLRRPRASDFETVEAVARRVAIDHLLDRPYRELSGGQQQRTLLARALAVEPDLLVLDEPTNGMDLAAERAFCEVVGELHRERGATVLFVTHLLHLVADLATRFVLLAPTAQSDEPVRVTEGDREAMLTSAALSTIYGRPIQVGTFAGHTVIVPE
jgi:ABC-type Mn2+/Zn2+ transport system ATPase subunit